MLKRLFALLCASALCFTAGHTADCQFDEYTDIKIVSDFEAVAVSINTLADCLYHLKKTEKTHEVVAFDNNNCKCCTVLRGHGYYLAAAYNWTTYKIRYDVTATTTTNKANVTQAFSTSRTSRAPNSTQEYTTGICEYSSTWLDAYETATLSVYSYDFDVCSDLNAAYSYENNMSCSHDVRTVNDTDFEITIHYSTERPFDYLIVYKDGVEYLRFSGDGTYHGVAHGSSLQLVWNTDSSIVNKGFCMKVTPIPSTQPPEINSTDTTASFSTQSASPAQTNTTQGICEYKSTVLNPYETATLSVYANSSDGCFDLNALIDYDGDMYCEHEVTSNSNSIKGFEITISYDSEVDYDYLTISSSLEEINFSGYGSYSMVLPGPVVQLLWVTDRTYSRKGFCMKITPIMETNPTPPPVMPQVNTTEAYSTDIPSEVPLVPTTGICQNKSVWLDPYTAATFSVYSYSFDLCSDLNAAIKYSGNMRCLYEVTSDQSTSFEFTIYYNTTMYFSYLELHNGLERLRFSGSGSSTGKLAGPSVQLRWSTANPDYHPGFCIKVTPTYSFTQPPAITTTKQATTETSIAPNATQPITTRGVCEGSTVTWVKPYETSTLALYSYDFDLCYDFFRLRFNYSNNMKCWHEVWANDISGFAFTIQYDTETASDFLELSNVYSGFRYTGYGSEHNTIEGSYFKLTWTTDFSVVVRGFCIKVSAINLLNQMLPQVTPTQKAGSNSPNTAEATVTTDSAGSVSDSTSSSVITKGICDSSSDYDYIAVGETATISVFSYDSDACKNLNATRNYVNNMFCPFALYRSDGISGGFDFTIYYDTSTSPYTDYVRLSRGESEPQFFYGIGQYTGSISGSSVQITWSSNYDQVSKGFCLQITPTI